MRWRGGQESLPSEGFYPLCRQVPLCAVTGRGQCRGAESSVDRTGAIARVQDLVVSVRREKRRRARQPVRRSQADISLPGSFSRQNCVEESEGCERDIKAQAPGVVPHIQPGELKMA